MQKCGICEMSQISLFQFGVTGQCEPSACVRLKPSPRQTLSKNGTLCLCCNAEVQWLWGKEQHSIRTCINQAVRFEKKQYILVGNSMNSVLSWCLPLWKTVLVLYLWTCLSMCLWEDSLCKELGYYRIALFDFPCRFIWNYFFLIKNPGISTLQTGSAVAWPKRIFI